MRRALVSFALCLAACGGGGSNAGTPPAESAGSERAAPAIPHDPLALLPAEPAELGMIDLAAWRASPHLQTLERWAQRFACLPLGPELPVLERTTRLFVAAYPRAPGSGLDVVVLAQGRYVPQDAIDVLGEVAEIVGSGPEPLGADVRGRFTLVADGARSAAVLTPRLLAVGDAAAVERVLAMADGEGDPGVRESGTFQALGAAQWLPERHLAIVSAGTEKGGPSVGGSIRGLDRSLARAIDAHPHALSLTLGDGVALSWLASTRDEASARTQVAQVQSALGQAELVLRLAGLPSIAPRLVATVEGNLARFDLALDDAEVASLAAALERVLATLGTPSCAPNTVAAPGTGT